MKEHEIQFHSDLGEFNGQDYLDKTEYETPEPGEEDDQLTPLGEEFKFKDALNRLNSFGRLNYGFYEMRKPIGGSSDRYVNVKLSTSGELDISGVVSLQDCEHVPWEYGSQEYLRSLNTGNQRYDFKISLPFNDENSVLWWKPDDKEPLEKVDDGCDDD